MNTYEVWTAYVSEDATHIMATSFQDAALRYACQFDDLEFEREVITFDGSAAFGVQLIPDCDYGPQGEPRRFYRVGAWRRVTL